MEEENEEEEEGEDRVPGGFHLSPGGEEETAGWPQVSSPGLECAAPLSRKPQWYSPRWETCQTFCWCDRCRRWLAWLLVIVTFGGVDTRPVAAVYRFDLTNFIQTVEVAHNNLNIYILYPRDYKPVNVRVC